MNTKHTQNIISDLSGLSTAMLSLPKRKRAENTRFKSFILHMPVSFSDYQTPPFIIKGIKKLQVADRRETRAPVAIETNCIRKLQRACMRLGECMCL